MKPDPTMKPEVGDIVLWAGERHRVVHLYEDCDEIVIKLNDDTGEDPDPAPFDVLWWSVESVRRSES